MLIRAHARSLTRSLSSSHMPDLDLWKVKKIGNTKPSFSHDYNQLELVHGYLWDGPVPSPWLQCRPEPVVIPRPLHSLSLIFRLYWCRSYHLWPKPACLFLLLYFFLILLNKSPKEQVSNPRVGDGEVRLGRSDQNPQGDQESRKPIFNRFFFYPFSMKKEKKKNPLSSIYIWP